MLASVMFGSRAARYYPDPPGPGPGPGPGRGSQGIQGIRGGCSFKHIFTLLLLLATVTNTYGGCEFPSHWLGRWFQSGVGILHVNRTSIETKGECYDSQSDKYLIFERSDNCYRCMVIHEKHYNVLQYKESFCDDKAALSDLCYSITGDAALYSMFRKHPEPRPVPCPFKQAPFTFTYNRGSGECSNPPSRAESCTDDSRLVLKYQACPDIQSTESNVEELVCVATWKEGSTRYLVGKLNQVSRRSALASDEDQYRCFIYERVSNSGGINRVTYHVAQSGDATCNGIQSAVEGSRTIRLSTADSHHGRCRFPAWITDHHTWLSLDHVKTYKFSLRNATLRITTVPAQVPVAVAASTDQAAANAPQGTVRDTQGQPSSHTRHRGHDEAAAGLGLGVGVEQNRHGAASATGTNANGPASTGGGGNAGLEEDDEVRVVCHSILQSMEGRRVQIVAHVTAGCDSGYVCMVFHKRDASVIEIQQSDSLYENTDDACMYFDAATTPYTTLIAPALHPTRCPHPGRYTVVGSGTHTSGNGETATVNAGGAGSTTGGGTNTAGKRKRRRQASDGNGVTGAGPGPDTGTDSNSLAPPECLSHDYEALAVGCGSGTASHDTMEFKSACPHQPISAYTCHGSWQENNTHYLIASPVARKSTDALRYCLVYTFDGENVQNGYGVAAGSGNGAAGAASGYQRLNGGDGGVGDQMHHHRSGINSVNTASHLHSQQSVLHTPPVATMMRLSGLSDTCRRHVVPGVSGLWAFNFTTNGACTQSGETGGSIPSARAPTIAHVLLGAVLVPLLVGVGVWPGR